MNIHVATHALRPGIARADASISVAAAVAVLRAEGALIIEDLLDVETLRAVVAETEDWFAAAPQGEGAFFGRATRRFGAVLEKAPTTAKLAGHPLVVDIMDRFLKGDESAPPVCTDIEISATQAIGIEPGQEAQFLHRDEELWPFPHDFEVMTNAMWAIAPFTAENGATRLIPGSHTWARDRAPLPGDALPAVCPAGSVVLWVGGLLHGGGANRSDAVRRGFVTSYKLGWLAAQEKLLLTVPPETVRGFPERLQRLLGYQLHKPNLGWIEGRDPIEWLRGKTGPVAAAGDNLTPAHEALLEAVEHDPEQFAGWLT